MIALLGWRTTPWAGGLSVWQCVRRMGAYTAVRDPIPLAVLTEEEQEKLCHSSNGARTPLSPSSRGSLRYGTCAQEAVSTKAQEEKRPVTGLQDQRYVSVTTERKEDDPWVGPPTRKQPPPAPYTRPPA